MDLKNLKSWVADKASDIQSHFERRKTDARLLLVLTVLGSAFVALTLTSWVRDTSRIRTINAVAKQADNVIAELTGATRILDQLLAEEQLIGLAIGAIENPRYEADLAKYLKSRIAEVDGVQVFGPDLISLSADEIGVNGFAVIDMLFQASLTGNAPLQIHASLQPPRLADAWRLERDDELAGYLMVTLDPSILFSTFNPGDPAAGYLGLKQFNGRQAMTDLLAVGDPGIAGEFPEATIVPGSLFRIITPQLRSTVLLASQQRLLLFFAGLLMMLGGWYFYGTNKAWARLQKEENSKKETDELLKLEMDRQARELPRGPDGKILMPEKPAAEDAIPVGTATTERQAAASGKAGREDTDRLDDEAGTSINAPDMDPPPMRLRYNITKRQGQSPTQPLVELDPSIFRAYDIRGIVGKTLDRGIAAKVGQILGTMVQERNAGPLVIGRDGRLSGPELVAGMTEGALSAGCDVLDIGAVPTGVLYFAAHELAAGSGVVITGSHNPPDYNGFKVMVAGDTLYGDQITRMYDRIKKGDVRVGKGTVSKLDVLEQYRERITSDVKMERPLRVVIDCGNGIGGVCAADVLQAVGAEVFPLFDEVDGTFPNHHPDPSDPKNLADLIDAVRMLDADIGLALDGDADRLGVVTLGGSIIYPDRVMMLLALDVLDRKPGATIIYDVKCTGHLAKVIEEAGGIPVMYKTGHSLIKARMKEIGSPFAGEMSGHFFFGERWYGVDDGIYAACRLLEILSGTDTPPEAILNALPTSFSTPEMKVEMEEGQNHDFVAAFQSRARFEGARINTIDGVRADFNDGWGLVRASNTTSILVVRFDGDTEQALERIKTVFRQQLLSLNLDLDLPF